MYAVKIVEPELQMRQHPVLVIDPIHFDPYAALCLRFN